jgi:hypothetical protein
MGWLAVINAPSVFSTLWPLVKSFLDPVTVSKIHVLGADYKEKLRELVDEDQLPVEYGGKVRLLANLSCLLLWIFMFQLCDCSAR